MTAEAPIESIEEKSRVTNELTSPADLAPYTLRRKPIAARNATTDLTRREKINLALDRLANGKMVSEEQMKI